MATFINIGEISIKNSPFTRLRFKKYPTGSDFLIDITSSAQDVLESLKIQLRTIAITANIMDDGLSITIPGDTRLAIANSLWLLLNNSSNGFGNNEGVSQCVKKILQTPNMSIFQAQILMMNVYDIRHELVTYPRLMTPIDISAIERQINDLTNAQLRQHESRTASQPTINRNSVPIFFRPTQTGTNQTPHQPTRNTNTASNHATELPRDGINAEKLEHLDGPDFKIPFEYRCPMTNAIMTDPVYLDKDPTNQRFERSWITHWLKSHNTHPLTRTNASLASLRDDPQLKEQINTFVQETLDNQDKTKSSTPSHGH